VLYYNCSRNLILSGKSTPFKGWHRKEIIMANFLSNAFSLNMLLETGTFSLLRVKPVAPSDIPRDVMSCIGHADTATVVSKILGFEVPVNRVNLQLGVEDTLYVAQYRGPRLPEGATELPEGATLEFLQVTIKPEGCGNCGAIDCNTCGMMFWYHGC
jgi:hypothetical protein